MDKTMATSIRPHHTACWSKWRLQRWRQIVDEWLQQLRHGMDAILHPEFHSTAITNDDSNCNDADDYNCDGMLMQQASYWLSPNSQIVTMRDWWQRQRRGTSDQLQQFLFNHT
ncbi:hypothetical protein ACLKA7_000951 [Drosophila subpalustris]